MINLRFSSEFEAIVDGKRTEVTEWGFNQLEKYFHPDSSEEKRKMEKRYGAVGDISSATDIHYFALAIVLRAQRKFDKSITNLSRENYKTERGFVISRENPYFESHAPFIRQLESTLAKKLGIAPQIEKNQPSKGHVYYLNKALDSPSASASSCSSTQSFDWDRFL